MSDKIIDIDNINTYPIELLEFCQKNSESLYNTFFNREINIDITSPLGEILANILEDKEFKALHATRTININDFYTKGLLIPSKSTILINTIIEGIRSKVDSNLLNKIQEKIKEKVKDDYKYETLWFILGNINDISLNNGFYMLEKFGGELLEDTFTDLGLKDLYFKKVAKIGEPYVVIFRVRFELIKNNLIGNQVINCMMKKILKNTKDHFWQESYVKSNIKKEDILKIEKIILEKNNE